MKYSAAIFDLDGTIIDSMDIWDNVGKLFLESQRIDPPHNLNEILKEMSLNQSASYFKNILGVTLSVKEIICEVNKIIEEAYTVKVNLKPYVKAYIFHLKDNGVKMCIATEIDKTLARKALKRLNVLDCFEFIITSEEVSMGKTKADIYMKSIERLGSSIKDTIIFEDALYCIKTAKEAGFDVAGVYDEKSEINLKEIKDLSDYFIYSFEKVEGLL